MKELEYPFNSEVILKKSKSLKNQLLQDGSQRIKKKIAILGGSTTHDIMRILELFLLNQGIAPSFYESEYGKYWEDVMFGSEQLRDFSPDLVYIHTSNRNISLWPAIGSNAEQVDALLEEQYEHFRSMWERIGDLWKCPIIQNNMEYPYYRLLGNQDGVNVYGHTSFVSRLNEKFAAYARENENFYINDINYQSAAFGLDSWSDPFFWHMYKYSLCLSAIPWLALNISNIIKSIYGKNKKALVLDLDNTLWGGIVGDDGVENLEIGPETSVGQVYSEFQSYIKSLKEIGIMLNVDSKNEEDNALAGLNHPDGKLKPEDFILIKANWKPKSENILTIAEELNILPDSMVFVDDNPAEREIIRSHVDGVAVPEMGIPEQYIRVLDHNGYFEITSLSEEDGKRNEMYKANVMRIREQASFTDYGQYLDSLSMKAVIRPFESMYMARIAQLTNKSNQFNLTTRRYTQAEIEHAAGNDKVLTLYGKLEDKFGDNGVVSVLIGHKVEEEASLHLDLWLMSCRVLKRDMEFAMMDKLVEACKAQNIKVIYGYYFPTAKNKMVKGFYGIQGFIQIEENGDGTVWKYEIPEVYEKRNNHIEVLG
ncbi:HAD family hydrolase [Eisenbergiella tayi]|nr:HAD family hydrolase [Eisenbergiella tayi]